MENYTIQLSANKGYENWNGEVYKQDMYIVVDSNNMDVVGQCFTKQHAQNIADDMNAEEKEDEQEKSLSTERLNLLGDQVSGLSEALTLLNCTYNELTHLEQTTTLNGLNVSFFTYYKEGDPRYFWSVAVVNSDSKQYE